MTAETPVTDTEFAAAMHICMNAGGKILPQCTTAPAATSPANVSIAVAVSGGGDSMALVLLIHNWLTARGGRMLALTVDHGLRPEAAEEARQVHQMLTSRGIVHEILTWAGEKPATHIQERARAARYRLLTDACRARGFDTLALAHNSEDQAETFWMRLSKGSGLDGLAGMDAVREQDGIAFIRPVLGFSRARLRATCAAAGLQWIEDPSNSNDAYLRVKLRAFEDMLAKEGLTPQRLARVMQKLSDAADALNIMTDEAAARCLVLHPEGYATLKRDIWRHLPREIQRRILARALTALQPQDYPVPFEQIDMAREELLAPGFAGKTLAGCELTPGKNGTVLILRQLWQNQTPAARQPHMKTG